MPRRLIAAGAAACVVACVCSAAAAQPAGADRPAIPPEPAPPAGADRPAIPPEPAPSAPQPGEPVSAPAPDAPAPADPASPPLEPPPDAPAPTPAPVEPAPADAPADSEEMGDQLIGGQIGLAAGGRTTAGGLRITGHYLYQLTDEDWFDGTASFTFGGGGAACFRDRADTFLCDHGLASGASIEVSAAVRRMFAPQGRFRPFARAAVGLALVRFTGDDLSGVAIPLHAGAGLRATVAPGVAVIALADAMIGLAAFGRGAGGEPQLGLAITAGAEVRLR